MAAGQAHRQLSEAEGQTGDRTGLETDDTVRNHVLGRVGFDSGEAKAGQHSGWPNLARDKCLC
jgi:hypothetical protein